MNTTSEIELKLSLPRVYVGKDILKDEAILKYSKTLKPEIKEFEAIYLDSKGGHLNKAGLALRMRKEGSLWVATVKTKGTSKNGLHKREEWDKEIEKPIPSIDYFRKEAIYDDLKNAIGNESLIELFTTKFERSILSLSISNKSMIELAVDIGEIIVKDKREQIAEVELELKKGDEGELNLIGNYLIGKYGLIPEVKSKFHRGLVLMNNN